MSTNPVDVIKGGVHEAREAMRQAADQLQEQRTRIDVLETALNRMVLVHENTQADSEGQYPALDSGCVECTGGATPDRYNTGLCAYHNAKKLLGHE